MIFNMQLNRLNTTLVNLVDQSGHCEQILGQNGVMLLILPRGTSVAFGEEKRK